ncbi:MAG: hypothetical protein LBU90_03735 [Bacteroidales bacterium]|jgi:hypothetical protein|nr:hypothetical protein [Bacteroidales bacterium]
MKKTASIDVLIDEMRKADPKSWLFFFNRYGLRPNDVNLENELRRAYVKHGKQFSNELNRMLIQSAPKIAAFSGEDLRSIVDTAFDLFGIENGITPEAKKEVEEKARQAAAEADEKEAKQKKTIILGFVAIVIVSITTFAIIRICKK